MTVRECLAALGFVADPSRADCYWHPGTLLDVSLCPERAAVDCSGVRFPGCRTVGDLRQLLQLLGSDVPGEVRTDLTGEAEADNFDEYMRWRRLDGTELRDDTTPTETPA